MTTDHIMRLLEPAAWGRTVLSCADAPASTRELAQHLNQPVETAKPEDDDEDLAYHRLKVSGRLFQQEVDRAHAIEVQMGLH